MPADADGARQPAAVVGDPQRLPLRVGQEEPVAGDGEAHHPPRRSVHTELFIQKRAHRGPVGAPEWERVVVSEGAGLRPAGPPLESHTADAGAQRQACQRRLLRDLLDATVEDREPLSSGDDGLRALELVMAVWKFHRQHAPVPLPLVRREHPVEAWLTEFGLPVPSAPEPDAN